MAIDRPEAAGRVYRRAASGIRLAAGRVMKRSILILSGESA